MTRRAEASVTVSHVRRRDRPSGRPVREGSFSRPQCEAAFMFDSLADVFIVWCVYWLVQGSPKYAFGPNPARQGLQSGPWCSSRNFKHGTKNLPFSRFNRAS